MVTDRRGGGGGLTLGRPAGVRGPAKTSARIVSRVRGHITYEAEVDPTTVRVCHCTDCQKLTGTAFRANIASVPGTFRLKTGTPKAYIKTAESGTKRAHAFCPECGTPISSVAPEPNPSTYGLRVGGIDQRSQFLPPFRQIWCRSALPWSMDLRTVEKSEQQ
jgi:hypothetical protein